MKTSKEMQLKILDRMKENVKRDLPLFDGIYRVVDGEEYILNGLWGNSFKEVEFGVYPEKITINGVEIPKPLQKEDIINSIDYFYVCADKYLYDTNSGKYIKDLDIKFVYETKEEAIEASKLLFGIK